MAKVENFSARRAKYIILERLFPQMLDKLYLEALFDQIKLGKNKISLEDESIRLASFLKSLEKLKKISEKCEADAHFFHSRYAPTFSQLKDATFGIESELKSFMNDDGMMKLEDGPGPWLYLRYKSYFSRGEGGFNQRIWIEKILQEWKELGLIKSAGLKENGDFEDALATRFASARDSVSKKSRGKERSKRQKKQLFKKKPAIGP